MKRHTGEKPHKCFYNKCTYATITFQNLKNHIKTHTGETMFWCRECDYTCIRKNDLEIHELNHSGIKPFVCNYCDFKTTSAGNLKRHKKRHMDEKILNSHIKKKTKLE